MQVRRFALVTGAGRGIGLEVVRQLADRGLTVYLAARDEAAARTAAASIPGDVRPCQLDITDAASIERLAASIDRLDVLVNNAAVYADWSERAATLDLAAARAVIDTNLFGTWRVSQAFVPLLRHSQHPRMVMVSSGAGSHDEPRSGLAIPGSASYAISKAALNALTAKLAAELDGMLINAVCPGLTATTPDMEAMGARPVADGAASIVWAALLPDDGPTGGLFRDGQPLPW